MIRMRRDVPPFFKGEVCRALRSNVQLFYHALEDLPFQAQRIPPFVLLGLANLISQFGQIEFQCMASVFRSASVKSNSMWPPFDAFEVAGVPSKRVQHLRTLVVAGASRDGHLCRSAATSS